MIGIVTATLDADRADSCISSWQTTARGEYRLYVVRQATGSQRDWYGPRAGGRLYQYWTPEILGVVPAFALGVQKALEDGCEIVACFHDDLEIEGDGWNIWITRLFADNPQIGLCGFGGGTGLADADIYQTPYNPMQLARKDFVSNMRDAEAHGVRSLQPLRVACLDGFSQIGRREYWEGYNAPGAAESTVGLESDTTEHPGNLFSEMAKWGIVHHCYDAALGCFAKRLGWETWMIPIACHHFGGRTAVGDSRYHQWANAQRPDDAPESGSGDQVFWNEAHRIVYDQFRDILPIRV